MHSITVLEKDATYSLNEWLKLKMQDGTLSADALAALTAGKHAFTPCSCNIGTIVVPLLVALSCDGSLSNSTAAT